MQKKGREDFNLGSLIFELSESKTKVEKAETWIEIVLGQIDMNNLISQ